MNLNKLKVFEHFKARQEATHARAQSALGVDLSHSRAGRIGMRLVTLGLVIETAMPLLVVCGLFALNAMPVFAQSPGGNIFGSSAETPGRGLVEAIKYARNIVFLAGIAFFMWAGVNMGFEKPWGGKAWAGGACWGFSGLAALVYEFSQGNAVNLDTGTLGR